MALDGLIVADEEFDAIIRRRAGLYERTTEEEFRYQAGRILHRLIRVTPPFAPGITSLTKAKRAGETAVRADLRKTLVPVALKGQRLLTHVFGNVLNDPIFVPTEEKWPNVQAAWQHVKRRGNRGRAGNRRLRIWVDESKFAKLERDKIRKVGILGGGYAPAADALGTKLPAFMRRHAGRGQGSIVIETTENDMRILIVNSTPYVDDLTGLERRVRFAVAAQRGAMERQMEHALKKLEREDL